MDLLWQYYSYVYNMLRAKSEIMHTQVHTGWTKTLKKMKTEKKVATEIQSQCNICIHIHCMHGSFFFKRNTVSRSSNNEVMSMSRSAHLFVSFTLPRQSTVLCSVFFCYCVAVVIVVFLSVSIQFSVTFNWKRHFFIIKYYK